MTNYNAIHHLKSTARFSALQQLLQHRQLQRKHLWREKRKKKSEWAWMSEQHFCRNTVRIGFRRQTWPRRTLSGFERRDGRYAHRTCFNVQQKGGGERKWTLPFATVEAVVAGISFTQFRCNNYIGSEQQQQQQQQRLWLWRKSPTQFKNPPKIFENPDFVAFVEHGVNKTFTTTTLRLWRKLSKSYAIQKSPRNPWKQILLRLKNMMFYH